jgi:hypothetical protein
VQQHDVARPERFTGFDDYLAGRTFVKRLLRERLDHQRGVVVRVKPTRPEVLGIAHRRDAGVPAIDGSAVVAPVGRGSIRPPA